MKDLIKEKSCGAVIFNDENNYILICHNAGHWDFPKGHVEDGESEIETARREIKEETALEVDFIEGFRESIQYTLGKNKLKEVVFFLAKVKSSNIVIQLEEIKDFAVLPFEKALEKITYPLNKEILKKAHAYLIN